jgi:hypothetical protein
VGGLGWYMQQYPSVDVAAQGYFVWGIEAKMKLFKLINVHRGYYESNALAGPRREGAVVAQDIGKHAPKAAWLLATVGVPISRAWEPIIKYETRAFKTSAQPHSPVFVLPHDADPDTDLPADLTGASTERVELVSSFETFVAGVRYTHSKDPSAVIGSKKDAIPPFYLGVGLLAYGKPYQVTVGDAVLDEVLFDARFRGAGLAFGLDTKARPYAFSVDVEGQTGLGEVRLLENLTLNELLPQAENRQGLQPPKWLIGYVTGNVTVGYLLPLMQTMPTPMIGASVSGGGATFFYFKTQAEEGETVDAPPLNWDLLWGARASFLLPL